MPQVFLIRHEEPELNGVFLGQLDCPLSLVGIQRAKALAAMEVAVVYTSPLQRARQTAECLRSPQIIELSNLREIDYGLWTGRSWAAIEERWNDLAVAKMHDWLGATPPGGEAWPDFLERVRRAWGIIRAGSKPAAVVCHQGVNAALAHIILGTSPVEFRQKHGEVIRVDYD